MKDNITDFIFDDSNKKKKFKIRYGRLIFLLVLVSAIIFVSNNYNSTAAVVDGDMLAAKVNDYEITMSELNSRYDELPVYYQSILTKTDLLNQLIDNELLVQNALANGYSVSDDEITAKLEELKLNMGLDDQGFMDALAEQNLELEELLISLKNSLLVEKYVDGEVLTELEISEDLVQQYYDENLEQFTQPEQIKASHILINLENRTEEEAIELINSLKLKLDEGDNFADIAKEYSDCPSSVNGGDLGFFSEGDMVPAFSEVAFNLEVDEISEPVKTDFGYHLILVTDKLDSKVYEFSEVKTQIEDSIKSEKEQAIFNTFLEQLKISNAVEIYFQE